MIYLLYKNYGFSNLPATNSDFSCILSEYLIIMSAWLKFESKDGVESSGVCGVLSPFFSRAAKFLFTLSDTWKGEKQEHCSPEFQKGIFLFF